MLRDFTQHPSHEVSAVLGTDHTVKLLRFDAMGRLLREQDFSDPAVASAPFMNGTGTHSGDANPAAIFADGYVREGKL